MKFAVMRISYCLFAIFCASLFAHALIHVIADASKSIQAGQSADIFGFEHFGQIVSDYGRWLIGVAQGNIGTMPGGQEISGLLLSAGMQTARIYLFVLILLGLIIGPLGYFSGKNRHGRLDRAAQYFTDALNSVPIMVVGILLLIPLVFLRLIPKSQIEEALFASIALLIPLAAPFFYGMRDIFQKTASLRVSKTLKRRYLADFYISLIVAMFPMFLAESMIFNGLVDQPNGLSGLPFIALRQGTASLLQYFFFIIIVTYFAARLLSEFAKEWLQRDNGFGDLMIGDELRQIPIQFWGVVFPPHRNGANQQTSEAHSIAKSRRIRMPVIAIVATLAAIILLAISLPLFGILDPLTEEIQIRLRNPSWDRVSGVLHLLGTDALGRDSLSRIIHAMRNSLYIAVGTAILTAVIGMALSMVLALSAKRFHSVINFLIEIKWSLTFFALSFLVFIPVKHSVISFTIVFSLLLWDRFWEITISEARRSDRPSPLALVRSVIRNQKKILVSAALIACAASIVFEITISFIGITLSGRMLSLGTLMSECRNFMFFKPHLMYIPALATVTLLLLINLLRSTLNTRDISN